MGAKRASSAVALLHGLAVVAGELGTLGWSVGLTAPHGAPHWQPRGEGARQEGHIGPPAGVAEPDAPSIAAARRRPVTTCLDARRPPKVARSDGFPENVVGQPQRVALRVQGGRRRVRRRGDGERVARGVRARELRGAPARLASQRQGALHAANPHQLGGLLPPDPLVLCLPGSGVGVDHRLVRRRCGDRRDDLVTLRGRSRGGVGGVGGGEDGAADGAGDVRREPGVDAVGVERVGAPGQEPEHVVVVELAEADGALERALACLVRPDVGVGHGREGVQHGPVEAADPPGPRRRRVGEPNPRAAPQPHRVLVVGVVGPAKRGPRASPEVDGEEAEQEEGRDEHDHDNGHGRVEVLGVEVVWPFALLRRHGVHGGAGESHRGEKLETAAIDRAHVRSCLGPEPLSGGWWPVG